MRVQFPAAPVLSRISCILPPHPYPPAPVSCIGSRLFRRLRSHSVAEPAGHSEGKWNSVLDSSSVFRPPQRDNGFAGCVILSAAKDLSSAGVFAGAQNWPSVSNYRRLFSSAAPASTFLRRKALPVLKL